MMFTVPRKQNLIFFFIVVVTFVVTLFFYHYLRSEWIVFRYAETKYESKHYDEAIKLYTQASNQGLKTPVMAVHLANSYVVIGQFNAAVPFYREYLSKYPNDTDTRLSLARALQWSGDVDGAEKEFQIILEHQKGK